MSILSTIPVDAVGGTFYISTVKDHAAIKEKLLEKFAASGRSMDGPDGSKDENNENSMHNDRISRTDWDMAHQLQQPYQTYQPNYLDIFKPIMMEHIMNVMKLICPPGKMIVDTQTPWFQQYERDDVHNWHVHSNCAFSSIYYVELHKETPNTLFSMFNKIFSVAIEEGCIITFPSLYSHSSPSNKSSLRKSVISFNMNLRNPTS